MTHGISIVAFLLLCVASAGTHADSWPGATVKAVASDNGEIVVRIIPGNSIGDTYGFAGAPKGRFASAQWFRYRDNRYELYQSIDLLNPVAPIQAAVANDGTLITLDNWHNVGFGAVVAIYAPDGKLRRSYRLADLYPPATIEKIDRSVSSIWWRCGKGEPSISPANVLRIDDALGGRFAFRLQNGEYTYEAGAGECKRP